MKKDALPAHPHKKRSAVESFHRGPLRMIIMSTEGGTRTLTPLRELDFESSAHKWGVQIKMDRSTDRRLEMGIHMNEQLRDDVENYCDFASIERITADGYRRSEKCFSRHLDRPATRHDLSAVAVNRWLSSLQGTKSPKTILNRKRGLTPVWNWLATQGFVDNYNPLQLKKIKVTQKSVAAWSTADVRALLAGSDDVEGRLQNGQPASAYLRAWIRIAYETGLRPSDMRELRWEDFADDCLQIVQHKTGFPIAKRISPTACKELDQIRSKNDKVFQLSKAGMRRWERKLWEAAEKHGFHRTKGQASGTLRKTHGTEVCRVRNPSEAALALGHVSGPRVALQSYIEASAIGIRETPKELIDALTTAAGPRHDDGRLRRTG